MTMYTAMGLNNVLDEMFSDIKDTKNVSPNLSNLIFILQTHVK